MCQEKYSSAHAVSNIQSKGGKFIKGGTEHQDRCTFPEEGESDTAQQCNSCEF